MNFLFNLIEVNVFVLFPLLLFKSFDGIILRNQFISKFVLLISLIFCLKFCDNVYFIIFLNIPLGVCILKNNKILYFILSVILMLFLINYIFYLMLECVILYFIFYVDKKTLLFVIFSILFYSLLFIDKDAVLSKYLICVLTFIFNVLYISKIYNRDISSEMDKRYSSYIFKFIHEVKNPLSVVLGYLEIINKKDNYDLNKCLMSIDKGVHDSLNIIEDYLMYGRFNVNFDYVDINMLLKDVSNDFKKLENIYDMNLNFYYDEEEIIILGDYSKLKQVIVNIIKNSIESHSERKLEIDIDYKIIKDNIIIDINDNGVGIKDNLSLGKEFYTTKEDGTGLGVNFSKNIISLHKGTIKYSSNEYLGTDVRICLPIVNI